MDTAPELDPLSTALRPQKPIGLETEEDEPPSLESLYGFPRLYETLRSPPPGAFDLFRHVIARHADGPIESMMDPACGPATWLLPFAAAGVRVAGNDLSPSMASRAFERLKSLGLDPSNGVRRPDFEITEGDMRKVAFKSGPFDIAFEASGTASYLRSTRDLEHFLQVLTREVRPGGLIVLDLIFGPAELSPVVTEADAWVSKPRAIDGGGQATIRYTVVGRDADQRLEHMRRIVHCENVPETPAQLEDRYALRLWSPSEVHGILARLPALELLGAYEVPGWDDVPQFSNLLQPGGKLPATIDDETLVVLRRRA